MHTNPWIKPTEYAEKYNLTRQAVYARVRAGKLQARTITKETEVIEVYDGDDVSQD